jgi:phage host-nuclease inhibitor protein Gam
MNFIDELLAEAEVADAKRLIEVNKLRADQLLMALTVLEDKANDINTLVDSEVALFEEYRTAEIAKLDKKMSWLAWNLEQYIKATGEKTVALPHGELKLRKGKDKIEITDMEKFLKAAEKHGLLRAVPESFEPDMRAVAEYTKVKGLSPAGTVIIPGDTKFTFKTKGATNGSSDIDKREQAEVGTGSERDCPAEIAEGQML